MPVSFKGAHFPQEIILTCVRWYVAYPLSTRHVEENEGSPQQAAGYQPPKPVTLKTAPSGRLDDGASYTSFRCLAA
jgi:hypothetical protein